MNEHDFQRLKQSIHQMVAMRLLKEARDRLYGAYETNRDLVDRIDAYLDKFTVHIDESA